MNKFDLVWSKESNPTIYVILSEKIDIPFFYDGCASDFANIACKLDDPREWSQTFEGYIVFNTLSQKHEIISAVGLELVKDNSIYPNKCKAYIPFDQATSTNRIRLGLLLLSKELGE